MLILPRPVHVEFFMQRDVMIARYHQLELRRRRFDHVDHGLVFGRVADFCDVAGVEENVGFGEREAVGVGWVCRREGRGGVGVGDDEEAGTDCLGRHDWGFAGVQ